MFIPNHPHDERLSALASGDADAIADESLTSHVDSCARCTETVTELGALRVSLSELPDLRPSRPLRLLPAVTDAADTAGAPAGAADRLAGWVRRAFAPALTAGAALAMVGLVGTAAPAAMQATGGGDAAAPGAQAERDAAAEVAPLSTDDGRVGTGTGQESADGGTVAQASADYSREDSSEALTGLPDRSPWPMVLFSGVALVIAALLLRWIVVPRAG